MSDPLTPEELRDIPAIRAEAERLACEFWDAVAERYNAASHPSMCEWRHVDPRIQSYRIEAHLDLLCDLSRPASRDAVARLVAAKSRIECGATAPIFRFNEPMKLWVIKSATHHTKDVAFAADHRGLCEQDHVVSGLDGITDPAEALRLIALHVLGADHV